MGATCPSLCGMSVLRWLTRWWAGRRTASQVDDAVFVHDERRHQEGRHSQRRRKPDDQDDGVGVPVKVGPRPLRGGAQAKPPEPAQRG